MPTAFITGATSGIGRAAALAFMNAGWRVVATGRRADRLEELAAASPDGACHAAPCDIRDADAIDRIVDALPAPFRDIDLLINSAGVAKGMHCAQETDMADWRTMIDTNVTGLATVTNRLLPALIARRGMIINIASVAARYPMTGTSTYAGTKAFVRQFSLCLRSDLHGTGVRVTCIEPGIVETEFRLVRNGGDREDARRAYDGAHPLVGEDIAATLLWVATQPPHINVNIIEVMPTSQSFAGFQVFRDG